jgi:hypothetical protein
VEAIAANGEAADLESIYAFIKEVRIIGLSSVSRNECCRHLFIYYP